MNPNQQFKRILGEYVSGLHVMIFACIVLGTGIVVLTVRSFMSIAKPTESGLVNAGGTSGLTSAGESTVLPSGNSIVESVDRERRTLNRLELQAARQKMEGVRSTLGEVEAQLMAWEREVRVLLTDERGRRIAVEPERVEKFAALFRQETLWTPDQVATSKEKLRLLFEPVEAAIKEDTGDYAPSQDWTGHLDREDWALKAAIKAYADTRRSIELLAREAPNAPGPTTLADAIAAFDQRLARERTERIEAEIRAERDKKTEELAKAEAEKVKAEAEQQKAGIDLARNRKLAEDPAIQAKYQPFLAKGRWRFGHAELNRMWIDGPSEMNSYNTLVKLGITTDLQTFVSAGCGKARSSKGFAYIQQYHKNDRPLWTTPYPKTDADWDYYRKLFEEFQQLAPIWRDMGLLYP